MKLRWTIVAISCVALIFVGLIIWHFVHAELTVRWLAKEAIAHRIRAEQGDAESQFKLGSMYEARESRRTMARPFADTANPPSRVPRRPNTTSVACIAMAREFLKTMRRLNAGAVKLLSRETRGPRRVLDSCITEAKECHRIMRRRRVGSENLPNKVMGTLNTSWATCITTATGWRRTKAKPTACSTKLPRKATRMHGVPLVGTKRTCPR